jgi:hypothetical protein
MLVMQLFGAAVTQSIQRLGYGLYDGVRFPAGAMMGYFLLVTSSRPRAVIAQSI